MLSSLQALNERLPVSMLAVMPGSRSRWPCSALCSARTTKQTNCSAPGMHHRDAAHCPGHTASCPSPAPRAHSCMSTMHVQPELHRFPVIPVAALPRTRPGTAPFDLTATGYAAVAPWRYDGIVPPPPPEPSGPECTDQLRLRPPGQPDRPAAPPLHPGPAATAAPSSPAAAQTPQPPPVAASTAAAHDAPAAKAPAPPVAADFRHGTPAAEPALRAPVAHAAADSAAGQGHELCTRSRYGTPAGPPPVLEGPERSPVAPGAAARADKRPRPQCERSHSAEEMPEVWLPPWHRRRIDAPDAAAAPTVPPGSRTPHPAPAAVLQPDEHGNMQRARRSVPSAGDDPAALGCGGGGPVAACGEAVAKEDRADGAGACEACCGRDAPARVLLQPRGADGEQGGPDEGGGAMEEPCLADAVRELKSVRRDLAGIGRLGAVGVHACVYQRVAASRVFRVLGHARRIRGCEPVRPAAATACAVPRKEDEACACVGGALAEARLAVAAGSNAGAGAVEDGVARAARPEAPAAGTPEDTAVVQVAPAARTAGEGGTAARTWGVPAVTAAKPAAAASAGAPAAAVAAAGCAADAVGNSVPPLAPPAADVVKTEAQRKAAAAREVQALLADELEAPASKRRKAGHSMRSAQSARAAVEPGTCRWAPYRCASWPRTARPSFSTERLPAYSAAQWHAPQGRARTGSVRHPTHGREAAVMALPGLRGLQRPVRLCCLNCCYLPADRAVFGRDGLS